MTLIGAGFPSLSTGGRRRQRLFCIGGTGWLRPVSEKLPVAEARRASPAANTGAISR